MPSDLETLPAADWVIDAAANPSVLAGVDGRTSSRQLIEHNLHGTLNLLEYCKRHKAGFILLSSSRVYSIPALAGLPLRAEGPAFHSSIRRRRPGGRRVSAEGTSPKTFPVTAAGFLVRQHQTGVGSGGPGIRLRVRFSGMDRSLRRAGRRGAIRRRRAGHFFLLDSRTRGPAPFALCWLRRLGSSSQRRVSSRRPDPAVAFANARYRAQWRAHF